MPALFSLWMIRRSKARTQARLRQAVTFTPRARIQRHYATSNSSLPETQRNDRYYLEGVGYLIGDISCRFNARSGHIRCAVNPNGPCQDCRHYEPLAWFLILNGNSFERSMGWRNFLPIGARFICYCCWYGSSSVLLSVLPIWQQNLLGQMNLPLWCLVWGIVSAPYP